MEAAFSSFSQGRARTSVLKAVVNHDVAVFRLWPSSGCLLGV